eukprot:gene5518-6203_t
MTNSSNAFRFIQPYCNGVAKSPSVESISLLQNALSRLEQSTFAERSMMEYVIFPLKLTLQRSKNVKESVVIKCLECMTMIFGKVLLKNENLFIDVMDTCCMLLRSKDLSAASGQGILESSSEELKSSIINLLYRVIKQSHADTFCMLYSEKNLPRLGHTISLLLALFEFEKDKNIRLKCLECLKQLIGNYKDLSFKQKKISSEVFCSFIPGISISLSRVVFNDPKIGQQLLLAIIETWKVFLILVMKDSNFKCLEKCSEENNVLNKLNELKLNCKDNNVKVTVEDGVNPSSNTYDEKQKLIITRDKTWIKSTQSKLNIILVKFLPLICQNEHVKVRLAAVDFTKTIMQNCAISMSESLPIAVEVLAGLLNDECEEVSKQAVGILQLGQTVFSQGNQSLKSIIEDSLHTSLLSLPRIMKRVNDKEKLIVLNSILGYITFLGCDVAKVFNSLTILEKVVKAFLQALELNVNDVKIVEEKSTLSTEDVSHGPLSITTGLSRDTFEQRFNNFNDAQIFKTIKQIFHAIGKYSDLQVVVDYLLDAFGSWSMYRKEAVLMVNEILIGFGLGDKVSLELWSSVIDQVITMYLSEEFWYLPTSNVNAINFTQRQLVSDQLELIEVEGNPLGRDGSEYWEKGLSFEQLNSNIQLVCLLIEGLAACSFVLKVDYNVFLIKVLYPLLEKHASENAQIARTAHHSLVLISKHCGEASVTDLITHNADYVINAISMSFRHLTLFSSAPCVLSVVLTYCDAGKLTLVNDVVEDVFYCLDVYQDDIVYSLMRVLRSLAKAVKEWFADEEVQDTAMKKPRANKRFELPVSPTDLRDALSEYCKLKSEALGEVDEDEDESLPNNEELLEERQDECNEDVKRDEKKQIPTQFQVIITTLEKCQHFLPTKDLNLKLLILDVIEFGVKALRHRKDDLLPAIHKLWPSIVIRLKEQQPVVITRALEVICVMIDSSEDFMRQRIRKDFLPVAAEYLNNQLKMSRKCTNLYKFSHACKLQGKLISLIGSMVVQLELTDKDLAIAATCCSAYLDCRQPQSLQNAAVSAIKKMKTIDSGYIWLLLASLYSPQRLIEPNSLFKPIPLLPKVLAKNDFTNNVLKIF